MRLIRLRLLRTPGIRTPFTLEAAPGINLVTGPNGAGKSSLCRAVRALLWPDTVSIEPFDAEAEFEIGTERLQVSRRDTDTAQWGAGSRPNLGPDHLAGRYELGVLDLLQPAPGDDPLAREIRRHMAGGFDLGILRNDLFPTKTGQAENRDLKTARAHVTRLQSEQQSLALEQDRLTELEKERALAAAARDRQDALETLVGLIRKTAVRDEAASRLEALPSACAHVRKDDPGNLKDKRGHQRRHKQQITDRNASLAAIGAELNELRSTGGMDPGFPLDLWKKKLEALVGISRDARQAEDQNGGPHLDEVLAEASVKPALLPVLLLLAAGAGLIAVGLLLHLPGPVLPWALVALGGGAGGAGVWGLTNYFRGAGQARQALEQRQEIARKKDHLERLRGQLDDALADFNSELSGSGIAPVSDTLEATQRLQDISDLREHMKSLETERKTDATFLEREKEDLERVDGEIREILERLELDDGPGAETEAARLLELSPDFRKSVQDRDDAAREIEVHSKRLAETANLLHEDETPGMSENRLDQLIEVEKQRAGELANLIREISDIEAAVGVAHRGYDLQEALAASASATATLTEARQTNRESALGRLLLDRVELQHENESRPLVLEKAVEYFRLFTGGRYELKMAGQAEGQDRFLARAEDSTRPLELQELSDGTRAQLLLAVKLAFMTVAEEGARPPIFLDDSLTSADPARFAAVAASLGRLATEEDRQIFYLTPNPADAAAFRRALAAKGLTAAHHIDLAEIRGVAGAADPSLLDPANLPANLMAPDPAGMSAAEYTAALKAAQPDPWAPWGALHVLFVLQENLGLVRRLVDGNASTLGRFQINRDTLIAAGIITTDEAARMEAGSELWQAWQDGWRIGRAQPVTREFLKDSAAVSGNYLEQVTAVLESCGWDGALLMEAIEAKKVKGFRVNKREQLRLELEEADLLAHGGPLSSEDLVAHILDRVAPAVAANILDMQKVRTMALTFIQMF